MLIGVLNEKGVNIKALNKGMGLAGWSLPKTYLNVKPLDQYGNLNWVAVDTIPEIILLNCTENFENIWNLHPKSKSSIIMHESDIDAHRYMQSYMSTPPFEKVDLKRSSYMFSGLDGVEKIDVPTPFKKLLEYVNMKYGHNYNQIVVNWYENGKDYLPMHSDWTEDKSKPFEVTMITLCEITGIRDLILLKKREFERLGCADHHSFKLSNGTLITLGGMTNTYYGHGINYDKDITGRRIGITFRHFTPFLIF